MDRLILQEEISRRHDVQGMQRALDITPSPRPSAIVGRPEETLRSCQLAVTGVSEAGKYWNATGLYS